MTGTATAHRSLTVPAQRGLDWSSGPCSALGHHFELRVPREQDFAGVFATMLQDFRVEHPVLGSACYHLRRRTEPESDGMPYGLYLGSRCLAAGRNAADFTKSWGWNLNQAVIRSGSRDLVLLHSACVTRAGVTLVLAADMESGKTTTTAGLLREGYDYVTDEATAIEPSTGRIVPFPKPLSLDPGSWSLFPELAATHARRGRDQWQVRASELGAAVAVGSVDPPRVVLFPRYERGAATRVELVRPPDALLELARMTFGFARHPARSLSTLARVTERAVCARLVIGDLDAAVRAIDEMVSSTMLEDL